MQDARKRSEQYPIVSVATIHFTRFSDAKCVFHNEEDAAVGQSLTDRNSGAASSGDTRRKVRLVGHEGASTQAMCEGFGSTRSVVPIRMAGMMPASI